MAPGGRLLAYDATRGLADGLGMPVHVVELADADRWLGGGVLPTVWLQQTLEADWWKAVAALVYGSHFVVTPLLLCVLWLKNRQLWGTLRPDGPRPVGGGPGHVRALPGGAAVARGEGRRDRAGPRLSATGWDVLGLPHAGALLADSQGQVNQVAAVPSLHTAFAVLTCLVLLPVARRAWQQAALVGYAVVMPLVLVWAGEHYVVDTLLGAAYAAVVVLAMKLLQARSRPRSYRGRVTDAVPTG